MAIIKVTVNGQTVELNKNEVKEAQRITGFLQMPTLAQRHWDIWARSAPTSTAQERRKAFARASGLSDTIQFL